MCINEDFIRFYRIGYLVVYVAGHKRKAIGQVQNAFVTSVLALFNIFGIRIIQTATPVLVLMLVVEAVTCLFLNKKVWLLWRSLQNRASLHSQGRYFQGLIHFRHLRHSVY